MSKLSYNLFVLFLYSFPFYTFINPGGILPFSLIFITLIFFIKFYKSLLFIDFKIPKPNKIDLLFLLFFFNSLFSVILNYSRGLNFNHVISHFIVFFLYYFLVRIILLDNKSFFLNNDLIFKLLSNIFYLIIFSVITDLFFHYIGINLADYLPLYSRNTVFGKGFTTRARGFFVEPTDLALALNIFTPLLIAFNFENNNFKSIKKISFLYLLILVLSRSTSGIVQFVIGFSMIIFIYLLKKKYTRFVSKNIFSNIFKSTLIVTFTGIIALSSLITSISETSRKLEFLNSTSDSASGDVRVIYWIDSFNMFLNSDSKFLGLGTGFTTLNQKTFNWFLTVLLENGILGLILILLVFFFSIKSAFKMKGVYSYAFLFIYLSIFMHLMSNTGFYYPYIWLFFSLNMLILSKFEKINFK